MKPKTNPEFWEEKRQRTVERDHENQEALNQLGWNVVYVWECEIKDGSFENWLPARIIDNV